MRRMTFGAALLCCLGIVLDFGVWGQGPSEVQTLFQRLQSVQTTDEATKELLKLGKADAKAREYLVAHLPAVIDKGPKEPVGPWMNAVRLAGGLNIAEAAPALAKWIGLDTGGTLTLGSMTRLDANPPAKALAQLGDPAVPVLAGVLQRGNLTERWDAVLALNLIKSPGAKNVLRSHLRSEPDSSLRSFIENSIK